MMILRLRTIVIVIIDYISLFVSVKQVQVIMMMMAMKKIFIQSHINSIIHHHTSPGISKSCNFPPWPCEERRSCWAGCDFSHCGWWSECFWCSLKIFIIGGNLLIHMLVIISILMCWVPKICAGLFFIIPCMDTIQVVDLRYIMMMMMIQMVMAVT